MTPPRACMCSQQQGQLTLQTDSESTQGTAKVYPKGKGIKEQLRELGRLPLPYRKDPETSLCAMHVCL